MDFIFTVIGLFFCLIVCILVLLAINGKLSVTVKNDVKGTSKTYGSTSDEKK